MEPVALTTRARTDHRKGRIVLTTHGSLGDLHPYVAIALGLKARGHEAILATGECYRMKIEALGIGFRPVRPDSDWVTDPEVMRRIVHPRWGLVRVLREVYMSVLRETYEDMLAAAEGADLLVAMQANYASRLVAEKKGIPWASAIHMPIGFLSAYDPPPLPVFPSLSRALRFLGPAFCKPVIGLIKWASRVWAKPLYRLRDEIGLPPDTTVNPLSDGHAPLLHLALFSKWIADKQPDWPPQTIVTGFPWYDQDGEGGLPAELARFLDDGRPSIVFTLGTAIAEDAGAPVFFEHSAAAAKLLGRRAVLILKNPRNRSPALPDGVTAFDYAPFSELFPRAAASFTTAGSARLAWRCGRGVPCWSCPVRGTSRTMPSVWPGWEFPGPFTAAATLPTVLRRSCDTSSTPRHTRGGQWRLERTYDKRTASQPLVTPLKRCSRRLGLPGLEYGLAGS